MTSIRETSSFPHEQVLDGSLVTSGNGSIVVSLELEAEHVNTMLIFQLAHELNVNSRDVLAACRQLGIEVRDSALAKLTSSQQSRLRRFFLVSQRVANLCGETQAKLLAGTCPWCGAEIFEEFQRPCPDFK